MFHQKSIAALVALALSPAVFAAESPVQTEEVVVTATRTATPVSKVLSDVSVITREEIEETGATQLTELLARQPGVMLTRNGGAGTQSSLMIRGASSNQTIILVDGVRIVSATSNTTALQHIPVEQIERIEILRGPASSLYGADGIGGVIQIFTRKGGDGAPQFNASAGVGNHGTFKASAGIAGKTGDTRYSLQVSHDQTDGFSATRPSAYSFNPDRDGNRNDTVSLNVAHELAKGQELGVQIYQTWANTQYDANKNNNFDDRSKARLSAQTLYSRNQITDNWQSLLRYSRSQDRSATHSRSKNWPSTVFEISDSLFKTTQDEWLWQNDISTGIGLFVAGASHTAQEVDATQTFDRTRRQVNAVFGSYQGEFGANLLQASLRRDNDSQFDGKTTGQFGYGYRFADGWLARASYGTAFKAPTFNDLYWPNSGNGFYGNPDLKPESAKNTELELAYAQNGHALSLTAFRNRIADLISYTDTSKPSYTRTNVNEAKIDGVTLEGSTIVSGFDLAGSATYLDARDAATDKQLTYRARQSASLSVSRLFGQLNVGVEQQIVGKRYSDAANKNVLHGYGLTNVFADYAMNKDWSVFGRVNNVFDRDYESVKDYNAPGVDAFIGVRYQPK